jgi:DNA-binding transcriptional ArsR family regulator
VKLRRDVFQALADPTRRAILLMVASQSMTAGAIAASFQVARPTISKHLAILQECSLLSSNKDGREIFYYVNAAKMKEVDDFLTPFRKMWEARFDQLEAVMKNYQKNQLENQANDQTQIQQGNRPSE